MAITRWPVTKILLLIGAMAVTGCVELKWETYTGAGHNKRNAGNYAGAEDSYLAALRRAETDLEPRYVAKSHNNLGILYGLMHDARAESHLLKAIEIHEKVSVAENVSEVDDVSLGKSLLNLGYYYYDQGRNAEATTLLHRALPIMEKAFAPNDPIVLRMRETLQKAQKGS